MPHKRLASTSAAAAALALAAGATCAQTAFTDITGAAGLTHSSETYGSSWGDLNGDGFPDLFVSNHRTAKSLFRNNGNGTFTDIAPTIANLANRPMADTHGASWADFDNNGTQDLFVTIGRGNPSEWYINKGGKLIFSTVGSGFEATDMGGRTPVWFDYDNDHRLDVFVAQYAGYGKLYHQNPDGTFTDTTSVAKPRCFRFYYIQLIDVNNDGRLDVLCSGEAQFPQKIYDTSKIPWKTLFDSAAPAAFFPVVPNVVDSAVADLNNDGRMDMFILSNVTNRPSSVVQEGNIVEAMLAGGAKGFNFISTGKVTYTIYWNKAAEGGTTAFQNIQIGAQGTHPTTTTITLDPANSAVWGMPPAPTSTSQLPLLQIGYDTTAHRWTLQIVTKILATDANIFSQGYMQVTSTAPITGLQSTGLWGTDKPGKPTLLMNRNGTFTDETIAAGLDAPVQCSSVTAGDFDNDMYVDLYLACRTGASNIANILYHNNGDGTFTAVPNAGGAAGPIGLALADNAGTADSVTTADYDNDGFLDLYVTNGFNMLPLYVGGPSKLYHNNGNANHWIELDLIGVNSDRDATGARVYATANAITQFRVQDGRNRRWTQDSKRIHFGLAGATSVSLTIKWPSGLEQTFTNVAANRVYTLTEGQAPK